MRKLALHWQIVLGMILGVVLALVLNNFTWGATFIANWIKPFGNIFINSLKLIAVPLILGSLVKGVSDLKDISKLSKMGFKTIGFYIFTTIVAVSIGLITVNIIKPGKSISEETRIELLESYAGEAEAKKEDAQRQREAGPLQALEDVVPENIFSAASENSNMLQVIFFSIFFGVALILIPPDVARSEEHTSELQSRGHLVCRLLLAK